MNISIWTNSQGQHEFSGERSDGMIVGGVLKENDKIKDFSKILDETKTDEEIKKEEESISQQEMADSIKDLQGQLKSLNEVMVQLKKEVEDIKL